MRKGVDYLQGNPYRVRPVQGQDFEVLGFSGAPFVAGQAFFDMRNDGTFTEIGVTWEVIYVRMIHTGGSLRNMLVETIDGGAVNQGRLLPTANFPGGVTYEQNYPATTVNGSTVKGLIVMPDGRIRFIIEAGVGSGNIAGHAHIKIHPGGN